MQTRTRRRRAAVALSLLLGWAMPVSAELIGNGDFNAGLADWTTADQVGSDGTFYVQTGGFSPTNGIPVPAPPQGGSAAMTDAGAPGSHLLYQDFLIPASVPLGTLLSFELFIGNLSDRFAVPDPPSLDFSTPALNQ